MITKIDKLARKIILFLIIASVVLFAYLLFSSLIFLSNFRKSVDSNLKITPQIITLLIKNKIKASIVYVQASLYQLIPSSNKHKLPEFYIKVDNKYVKQLDSNLPSSGKSTYIPAILSTKNESKETSFKNEKVKLRYRGDNNFHWFYPQKSLRIKLDNNVKFNLINPQFSYSYIDIISRNIYSQLDILAPKSHMVKLFINGRYMGVYTYIEQVDEKLLRDNKKMPGSIYFGEHTGIWNSESKWIKQSSRNADFKKDRRDLISLIDAVNNLNDIAFYNYVNTYMDKNKWFSFFALDSIFGTSIRDQRHNHKIYFDPYKGKFEPIIWDIRWWAHKDQKDMSSYLLVQKISRNPILEYERDRKLFEIYNSSYVSPDSLLDQVTNYIDSIKSDIKRDRYRDTAIWTKISSDHYNWISRPFYIKNLENDFNTLKRALLARRQYLSEIFHDSNVEYAIKDAGRYKVITIKMDGNTGVEVDFSRLIKKGISVFRDSNLNSKFDESDMVLTKSSDILLPGRKIQRISKSDDYILKPSPINYRYFLLLTKHSFSFEDLLFKNLLTKNIVKPKITNKIISPKETVSIHPWLLPEYEEKTITLSGNQYITKDTVYDQYTTVNILPGTKFYLDPKASLFFYGKVIAKGTPQQPITFLPSNPEKSFGAVVLQGQKTAGSILENIKIEKGSKTTHNLIDYTAQLNIHDTKDITIKNCDVGENFEGDDSLHLAYVENANIENCTFHSARSDAVDVDISSVNFKNNLFINAGNDLLDFMTSDATVENNLFINSGDKGISVGEWSNITIKDNFFYFNLIGVEVKDKSEVKLEGNNLIVNSKVAPINLYNKNKFYDKGGYIYGERIFIIGENNKITKDKKSKKKIKKIKTEFPSPDKFKWMNKFFNLNDWSDLEIKMKNIIRSYPW